jgi:protein tyrosine/serine phosphatase
MSSLPGLYRPSRFQSVLFLSLFIAATYSSFSQSGKFPTKTSNFGQINENYFRGGQPHTSDFPALKKMGIKTIVDLQKGGPFQEASWVQNAGMQYFKIPLSSTHPATAEQTEYFLKLVNNPANWPVYVHCAGGRHRTGEMTAIYRITHDSWTADRAYVEMKQFGYYAFPNHGSLRQYVYSYYQDFQSVTKKDNAVPPVSLSFPTSALN